MDLHETFTRGVSRTKVQTVTFCGWFGLRFISSIRNSNRIAPYYDPDRAAEVYSPLLTASLPLHRGSFNRSFLFCVFHTGNWKYVHQLFADSITSSASPAFSDLKRNIYCVIGASSICWFLLVVALLENSSITLISLPTGHTTFARCWINVIGVRTAWNY